MKILLIDPPGTDKGLNIGLFYLATSLIENNYNVSVLCLNNEKNLKEEVINYKPDIIGFSIHSPTYNITKVLINSLKKFYTGYIIVGGPQAKIEKETIFDEIEEVNALIIGEAEELLPKVITNLKEKAVYEAELIKELDKLSPPDYKLFGINKLSEYPIITSRSCPYNCIFCYNPDKVWRAHSPEYVINELLAAKKKYNPYSFRVQDAVFNISPERVKEICKLLINIRLNMSFTIDSFVANKVDDEMIKCLREAGCYSVSIGVETLVDDIYKNLNKPHTIDEIKQCVLLLRKYKIKACGNLIIGLPYDNYKNSLESIRLAKQLKFSSILVQLLVPYPGTSLYEWVKKNAKLLYNYKEVDATNPEKVTFETDDFKKEERIKLFKEVTIKNKIYPPKSVAQSYLSYSISIIKMIIKYDKWNIFSHLIKMGILGMELIKRAQKRDKG